LVGMARYGTGAWETSDALIRSYYNDNGAIVSGNFTANRSTTSTSYVEINTEIRCEYLSWDGELVEHSLNGACGNSNLGRYCQTSLGVDGTTAQNVFTANTAYSNSAALSRYGCALSLHTDSLSEGFHYTTVLGKVDLGTGTWAGTGTSGTRTALFVKLSGKK